MHKEPRLISDLSKLYSYVNKKTYQLQENLLIYTQDIYSLVKAYQNPTVHGTIQNICIKSPV